MKTTTALSCAAALVLACAPALADAPAKAQAKPSAKTMQAISEAAKAWRKAFPPEQNPVLVLDKMATFELPPDARALMIKLFGTEHPLVVEKTDAALGEVAFKFSTRPWTVGTLEEGRGSWSELTGTASADKAGKTMRYEAKLDLFKFEDADTSLSVKGAHIKADQVRLNKFIWNGSAEGGVGAIEIQGKNTPPVSLEGMHFKANGKPHGALMDITSTFGIDALKFAGEDVGAFQLAMRFTDLDIAALTKYTEASEKIDPALTPQARAKAMGELFKILGKSIVARGSAMHLDELTVRYKDNAAALKGKISLKPMSDADMAKPEKVMQNLVARFEADLPVAMIEEIAKAFTRKDMQAKNPGQPVDEAAVAQMAATMKDVVAGKMLTSGYAEMRGTTLHSLIEISGGKLTMNGKVVEFMPKPQKVGAPAASLGMPPRQVSDKCPLPPFPAEAVEKNLAVDMEVRFIVGRDGKARSVRVNRPSQWPEFDAAAVKALEACQWIPGLNGAGKEVDVPFAWRFNRPVEAAPAH